MVPRGQENIKTMKVRADMVFMLPFERKPKGGQKPGPDAALGCATNKTTSAEHHAPGNERGLGVKPARYYM